MKTYTIREILENTDQIPDSWLYLPNSEWTLNTRGAFSLDSRDFPADSTEHLPPQVQSEGWKEILDKSTIEDIIFNVDEQLPGASIDDYFEAFRFYYANDAFKVF